MPQNQVKTSLANIEKFLEKNYHSMKHSRFVSFNECAEKFEISKHGDINKRIKLFNEIMKILETKEVPRRSVYLGNIAPTLINLIKTLNSAVHSEDRRMEDLIAGHAQPPLPSSPESTASSLSEALAAPLVVTAATKDDVYEGVGEGKEGITFKPSVAAERVGKRKKGRKEKKELHASEDTDETKEYCLVELETDKAVAVDFDAALLATAPDLPTAATVAPDYSAANAASVLTRAEGSKESPAGCSIC